MADSAREKFLDEAWKSHPCLIELANLAHNATSYRVTEKYWKQQERRLEELSREYDKNIAQISTTTEVDEEESTSKLGLAALVWAISTLGWVVILGFLIYWIFG